MRSPRCSSMHLNLVRLAGERASDVFNECFHGESANPPTFLPRVFALVSGCLGLGRLFSGGGSFRSSASAAWRFGCFLLGAGSCIGSFALDAALLGDALRRLHVS